ncbi:MAG TPA: alpha/beta fold hydrolase [Verrucomicrobiae bacterium]|nr:alpha/beta fold hydrolase [Verrucomicrobiae bacterium]
MRLGKLLLLFCSAIYLVICAVMAVSQRSFIYHPRVFTREEVERRAEGTKLERWTNSIGEFIGFKHLSVRQPADGIVLIAYGNGSTAIGSDRYANDIQSAANFDVYILEYPGYEDRPGEPSQTSLFAAATEAFQLLPANKPIYLVGESLGTGVASFLAGKYPDKIAGIFLISPFNNLAVVAQHHFPFLPVWPLVVDRFPSERYLRNYHGGVGISVDGKDDVVPEKFGLKLYDGYSGPKKLWEFPSGGHCQITESPPKFWHEVIEFWQNNQMPVK